MALELQIFADTTRRQLVLSRTNSGEARISTLQQEDKINVVLHVLAANPDGNPSRNPYLVVSPDGLAISLKIGDLTSGTIYSNETAWTPNGDQGTVSAAIDLNTVAMGTAFTGVSSVSATLAIKIADITAIQVPVIINKSLIVSGTPNPATGQSYYTASEADNVFLGKDNAAGQGFTLRDSAGVAYRLFMSTDGDLSIVKLS